MWSTLLQWCGDLFFNGVVDSSSMVLPCLFSSSFSFFHSVCFFRSSVAGLGCQIWVLGGLGCQIGGFGRQHRELNPRLFDPKPCGQPLGYMGVLSTGFWVVWGAKYAVLDGLGCQVQGFGWLGVPSNGFCVVWGAKYRRWPTSA